VPVRAGRDQGDLHRVGIGLGAALARGQGARLGDGGVRDAPGLDRRAQGARLQARAPRRRSTEIQRLIGRSLRGVVDLNALPDTSIYVDCDVLQADGGTRCASITGGYVALRLATQKLLGEGLIPRDPLTGSVAAISCGMVDGEALCDLDYSEDSRAEVDANIVMTGEGGLIEVQATAERTPVSRASLDDLLAMADAAIVELRKAQAGACGDLPG
jgi:ribonuclease PH